MKSTVIACAVLILISIFSLVSPKLVASLIDEVDKCILALDSAEENTLASAKMLTDKLEQRRILLSVFLNDNTVREMRGYATDILAAAENGDDDELNIAKSRLLGILNQQRRLVSFDPEAIL